MCVKRIRIRPTVPGITNAMAYPVYSRTYLQSLKTDADLYSRVDRAVKTVLTTAHRGGTRYILPQVHFMNYSGGVNREIDRDRFIALLQERLPGCTLEYRESTRLDGTVEAGIVIDWL